MELKAYSRKEHLDPIKRYSIFNLSDHNSFYHIHTHQDLYEIFLCVKGTAVHLINNHEQKINTYSLTCIRPDDVHGFIDPIDEDFQVLNMSIDRDVMEDAFEYLGMNAVDTILLKPVVTPNVVVPNLEYHILKGIFEKMFILSLFDKAKISLILRMTVINILSYFFSSRGGLINKNLPLWMWKVIDKMYQPEFYVKGVKALYEIAYKCPEHVCREFKKYLNKTPTEMVNEIRMEDVVRRLIYTDEKVIDICSNVGFENLSHFYHWFKKKYGMSPLEFRCKSTIMKKL